MFAIIAAVVVTAVIVVPATLFSAFWMMNRGAVLKMVGIVHAAASHGENYVEKVVGGCHLRQPLEVEFKVLPIIGRFDKQFLLKRILRQVQHLDKNITAICYNGAVYAA